MVPGSSGSQISWQRHRMVVSLSALRTGRLTHRPPYAPAAFTPRKCSWYSFLLEAESTPGPWYHWKDFISMKIPLTVAGIEPVKIRFVAQHLNHCATAVSLKRGNHESKSNKSNWSYLPCEHNWMHLFTTGNVGFLTCYCEVQWDIAYRAIHSSLSGCVRENKCYFSSRLMRTVHIH